MTALKIESIQSADEPEVNFPAPNPDTDSDMYELGQVLTISKYADKDWYRMELLVTPPAGLKKWAPGALYLQPPGSTLTGRLENPIHTQDTEVFVKNAWVTGWRIRNCRIEYAEVKGTARVRFYFGVPTGLSRVWISHSRTWVGHVDLPATAENLTAGRQLIAGDSVLQKLVPGVRVPAGYRVVLVKGEPEDDPDRCEVAVMADVDPHHLPGWESRCALEVRISRFRPMISPEIWQFSVMGRRQSLRIRGHTVRALPTEISGWNGKFIELEATTALGEGYYLTLHVSYHADAKDDQALQTFLDSLPEPSTKPGPKRSWNPFKWLVDGLRGMGEFRQSIKEMKQALRGPLELTPETRQQFESGLTARPSFKVVWAAEFTNLPLANYNQRQAQFESLGLTLLADIEDETATQQAPSMRTFTRVMVTPDRLSQAGFYEVVPKGMYRLILKGNLSTMGLESLLSDGNLLETTTANERMLTAPPPGHLRHHLPEYTSEAQLLETHQRLLSEYLSSHPGVECKPINDCEDAQEIWRYCRQLKSRQIESGGVSDQELTEAINWNQPNPTA